MKRITYGFKLAEPYVIKNAPDSDGIAFKVSRKISSEEFHLFFFK